MSIRQLLLSLCLLIVILGLSSCSDDNSLNIGFRNMGKDPIFAFDSKVGKFNIGAGSLAHGATSSTHLYFKGSFEFPESVIVKWRKPDDSIVTKTVQVKGKIPNGFKTNRDEMIFNIFPNDAVKLSFEIKVGKSEWKEIDTKGNNVDYGKKK